MTTYIDTSAFLALLNADDRYHASAVAVWRQLLGEKEPLVCNNYVLVETITLLQNRFGQDAVRVFQEDILPVVTINWVDVSIHLQAISALLASGRRRVSLVDWSAIEMMRSTGARRIFTFDQHFEQYGLSTMP